MLSRCKTGQFLLVVLLLCVWPAASPAATHALLIGISDYPSGPAGPSPLDGPKNDIPLVRGLLTAIFRVPDANIKLLTDRQATHRGIQKAFEDLARVVRSGDQVFIHYSGHGSEAPDRNGDEPSGRDQTWVPYGARTGLFAGLDDHDLLDDEIDRLLTPIYAVTDRVVFASDSCHSGSVGRGPLRKSRGVPPDPRPHPLGTQALPVPIRKGIRIGAAQDNELAWETGKYNRQYGQFTWYWVRALEATSSGESWRNVFDRTTAALQTEQGSSQHPQIEGDANSSVFGPLSGTKAGLVPVIESGGKEVTLGAGQVAGVTEGSLYRLYAPGSGLNTLAPSAEIVHADAFTSKARTKSGLLKPGDLMVEVRHAYTLAPLKLVLLGDFITGRDENLGARIRGAINDLPGFAMTTNRAAADWALHIIRPNETAAGRANPVGSPLPASDPERPPEVWVADPEGKLLHPSMRIALRDPEAGVQLLKQNLGKFARMREIRRLASRRPAPFGVTATRLQPDPGCNTDCIELTVDRVTRTYRRTEIVPMEDLARKPPRQNEALAFSVRNDAKRDFYVALLSISPESGVWPVYPRLQESQQTALVAAGQRKELNPRFNTILFANPGEESVKLIVSTNPIDVRLFEVGGLRAQVGRSAASDPLTHLLEGALNTRDARAELGDADWGTLDVTFSVTE
jgi:hypothetical protein